MRKISWASGFTNRLRFTSHAHCAKKISSSVPATTCGRPKRSRVKNLPINRERVFYYLPDLGIRGVRIALTTVLGRRLFVSAFPSLLMARVVVGSFGLYCLLRQAWLGQPFRGGAAWRIAVLPTLLLCLQ